MSKPVKKAVSKPKRISHKKIEKEMLKNPAVKAEFDRLMGNFDIVSKLIEARIRADKTQAEVADFMDTTASTIARIEAGGGKKQHSPSLITLQKYAAAVGCELDIKLKPLKISGTRSMNKNLHARGQKRAQLKNVHKDHG